MECDCNIHHVLHDEITVIDSSFECLRNASRLYAEKYRSELFSIIDKMGHLSAKAQSLPGAITTGMKLMYSGHRLYILKDKTPDTRQVIGILKVGQKKLFVYDMHGVQHELEPLCVLDFYVHESRQRQGCGRKLFDFMIQREGVIPRHFAIDRPSHKFSAFLEKHYLLSNVIPQMNNFVVFQGFFRDRSDYPRGRRYRSAMNGDSSNRNTRSNGIHSQQNSAVHERRTSPTLPRLPSASSKRQSARPPPVPVQTQRPPPAPVQPPQPEVAAVLNLAPSLKSMMSGDEPQTGNRTAGRRTGIEEVDRDYRREEIAAGPVLLRRTGSNRDVLNGHQEYLTRDGRLRVNPPSGSRRDVQSAHYGSLGSINPTAAPQQKDDANWTMYTGANNNYTYQVGLNRNYKHTRLW